MQSPMNVVRLLVAAAIAAALSLAGMAGAGAQAEAAGAGTIPIEVRARGTTGEERITLEVDGVELATWTLSTTEQTLTANHVGSIASGEVRVIFGNDAITARGDRNVRVGHITVGDRTFETEDPATWSTGSWTPDTGCAGGNKQTEWLHCNGYFQYQVGPVDAGGGGTELVVRARGASGEERITVVADQTELATVALGTGMADYRYQLDAIPGTVEVRFINNGGSSSGVDRDVQVDSITVGDRTFQTEASTVASLGSWSPDSGCAAGFKQSEWLHCNGYFRFVIGDPPVGGDAIPVIFDTDMGPDIDDALALAMLHDYADDGLVDLKAVTISRNTTRSGRGHQYTDALNTFYGRPDIPIGYFNGSTIFDTDGDYNFVKPVLDSGRYQHSNPTPIEGYRLMRKVLAEAADGSVAIIQVGFSSNTAALLNSGPDEYSPLTGVELVARKARVLSIMAGDNRPGEGPEFNVRNDLSAAKTVFADWPVEMIQSDLMLGWRLLYPASDVCTALNDPSPHIIQDSYLANRLRWHDQTVTPCRGQQDYPTYNMRSWDLTSVLVVVEPELFEFSPPGRVTLDQEGSSTFTPSTGGPHRYLEPDVRYGLDRVEQADRIIQRMTELVN